MLMGKSETRLMKLLSVNGLVPNGSGANGRANDLPAWIAGMICMAMLMAASLVAAMVAGEPAEAQSELASGTTLGVASCGGTTCHGRQEADGAVVRQDEILRWQEPSTPGGAHSRAWRVLTEPRSVAIAKKLGIGDAASSPRCINCHGTPTARTGPKFQQSDGVNCEACHGPASGWIAAHYAVGASHARNVQLGLVPLENPKARADNCLDCHFGSSKPGQFVTHEIMAAGHPRISFELDLFSALQQHHDEDVDYAQRKGTSNNVRFWAVGQAMALERSLELFGNPKFGSAGLFPEFYFFDCHSCHRRIYDDVDYRPAAENNPGRPIRDGDVPYNDENMIMLSAAVKVAAPGMASQYEARVRALHQAMTRGKSEAVAEAAKLRQFAAQLADAFTRASFSRAQTFAIMDQIASGAISPRFTDYEGSVQAVMAIDTLLNSLVNSGQVSESAADSLRGQINQAYGAVAEPNSYQPAQFRRALGSAIRTIRNLR
jgi:hypothetical protein